MLKNVLILSINKVTLDLWKTALLAVVPLMALAACTGDSEPTEPAADSPAVRVVTTTNIVADWVENIGGEHVEVFSLVPIGADPHSYQPGAQDVARIAEADLVLTIGLRLEEAWLQDLVESAAGDPSIIIELAEMVDPIEFGESHAEEVETIEELSHIVHEVAEGEISPEEGLEEIKAYLAGVEREEEGDHHGEGDELVAMVLEIVNEAEEGHRNAGDAIEAIEGLTSRGKEEHEGHGHGPTTLTSGSTPSG